MKIVWRALRLIAVPACVLAFAAVAQAHWEIDSAGGDAFSATYTNDAGGTVNNVLMGSSGHRITKLQFFGSGGGSCTASGTAECSNLDIAPGETVTFKGEADGPVLPGQQFQINAYVQNTGHYEVVTVAGVHDHLSVRIVGKNFNPTQATLTWNATVTMCNEDHFNQHPFSFSKAGKYTTLVHESEGGEHVLGYYLPVPKTIGGPHPGRRLLAPVGHPNACGTFSVNNTSGQPLTLQFFDAIHSRAKMTLTIQAKPIP